MILQDSRYYNGLLDEYEQLERHRTRNQLYLDPAYYRRFEAWLVAEHKCRARSERMLEFNSEQDATMFLLKWNG